MATVTTGYTFVNNETVTPAKLNSLAGAASVSNIQTADIADGQITLAKLVTTIQQALLPAGAVQAFAMNAAPSGWLAADGSAVSRTTYASLFAAIGTQYGVGDGSTTFALPDLRGYFVRGSGTNGDGTASGTFATKQADDFKSHTHTATVTDPGHSHTTNAVVIVGGTGLGGGSQSGTAAATVNSRTTGITVSNASTGGTETRPKNIAMLYCIKF